MQAKLNPALGNALQRAGIIPVLTIESAEDGIGVARALVAGGLDLLEVTLRTPAALEAMRRIRAEVPEARIGAGTVLTPEQGRDAILAGAQFIVSPGMTPRLIQAAEIWPVPFLPGAVTASEAMALGDLGYRVLKFFPAEAAGGVAALRALSAPLQNLRFCPTGGIDQRNVATYLALGNVSGVGGSWVAPSKLVQEQDWDAITSLAKAAAALRKPIA